MISGIILKSHGAYLLFLVYFLYYIGMCVPMGSLNNYLISYTRSYSMNPDAMYRKLEELVVSF